jgi:hypothetical protein
MIHTLAGVGCMSWQGNKDLEFHARQMHKALLQYGGDRLLPRGASIPIPEALAACVVAVLRVVSAAVTTFKFSMLETGYLQVFIVLMYCYLSNAQGLDYPLVVDEIFLQLCKQLTRNPGLLSEERYWQVRNHGSNHEATDSPGRD